MCIYGLFNFDKMNGGDQRIRPGQMNIQSGYDITGSNAVGPFTIPGSEELGRF